MSGQRSTEPEPVTAARRGDRDGAELPAKIADIRLDLTSSRHLDVPTGQRGIDRCTVVALVAPLDAADVPPTPQPVGEVDVIVVDLLTCPDPWQALDSSNEHIAHIGEVLFDINTGQLVEELASRFQPVGRRLLLLDRIELQPEWQGQNVAALIAAEALDQLRAGARLAVCLPGPLDRPEQMPDEEYQRAVTRMQGVWSQLGFHPFREGVWILDPSGTSLDEALVRLRARHGLTRG